MVDSPYRHIPYDQRMSPHYKGKTVQRLGLGHMLLGILSISFQAALYVGNNATRSSGAGFWAGAIFLITGGVGVFSSKDPRWRPPAITFLLLSVASLISATAMLAIALHGALMHRPQKDDDWTAQLIFLASLTVIGVTECLVCVVSFQVVCKGLFHCCVAVQQAIESETTAQAPAVVYTPDKSVSPVPA